MTLPILYSFRRCPFAMRARLALYSAKINHEHREVDLKNKPPEMLAISPKGTVPVLQLADGGILEQSLDIMLWALTPPSISPMSQKLLEENDTTFKHVLDRYKYPGRYPQDQEADYRALCEVFLGKVEASLTPFLAGEVMTWLDMAIFPFIRQMAMVDPAWFETIAYPRVKAWLASFYTSELYDHDHVMREFPFWVPGGEPVHIKF